MAINPNRKQVKHGNVPEAKQVSAVEEARLYDVPEGPAEEADVEVAPLAPIADAADQTAALHGPSLLARIGLSLAKKEIAMLHQAAADADAKAASAMDQVKALQAELSHAQSAVAQAKAQVAAKVAEKDAMQVADLPAPARDAYKEACRKDFVKTLCANIRSRMGNVAPAVFDSNNFEKLTDMDSAQALAEMAKFFSALVAEAADIKGKADDDKTEAEMLNKQISNLNFKISGLNAQIAELKQRVSDAEAKAQEAAEAPLAADPQFVDDEALQTEINKNKALEAELDKKDQSLLDAQEALKQKNQEISSLKAAKEQADRDLDSLNKAAEATETRLKKQIADVQDELKPLKQEMANESRSLLAKAQNTARELAEYAAEHPVFAACNPDYYEKAEDKNQELADKLHDLADKLDELKPMPTLSEQTDALSEFMQSILGEKYNAVNKLLQYNAFSAVPFMIDSRRDNGLYFNRKAVKALHEKATVLLACCGITPQQPALFAENATDGDYQVGNSFNDVEAFCPGSLATHKAKVDRADADQLIIGVATVGYTTASGQTVPSVVLV